MTALSSLLMPDGSTFELYGTCTLGRSPSNTLRLSEDERISRRHALLQFQSEGEYWLVDLGGRNGTSINGRRVSQPLQLQHGDVLEFAGCDRLVFQTNHIPTKAESNSPRTRGDQFKRKCWLLVADITDSTGMIRRLPPDEIPLITGGWFNDCRKLIEDHGGHMNQFLGDGYFCYWIDAAGVTTQILAALRELGHLQATASPDFRTVLHYGEIMFSGVPRTGMQNLHGQEVHFAFRLEKIAAGFGDRLLVSTPALRELGVGSLVLRESAVSGFTGTYQFHVPDLELGPT